MQQFDWILFDLDNTILDFTASSELAFNLLMKDIGLLPSETDYDTYREINRQVWTMMEAGKLSHDELKTKRWTLYFAERQIQYDPAEANKKYFEYIKINPVFVRYAQELLEELKGNFQLAIITNGLAEVQRPRIEKTGLDKYFAHFVISDELGVAKPNHDYFEYCHQLIQNPPKERVLVVGDTFEADIQGAKNYGYKSCWYNPWFQSEKNRESDYIIRNLKELRLILDLERV